MTSVLLRKKTKCLWGRDRNGLYKLQIDKNDQKLGREKEDGREKEYDPVKTLTSDFSLHNYKMNLYCFKPSSLC